MLRGIDATKAGMLSVLEYNDNLAHTLANANTTGFKQTQLSFKNIHESVINAMQGKNGNLENGNQLGTLSQGSVVDNYKIDWSQGVIKNTGRSFDFAISGDGFFKMKMPDESFAYTRNGVLQVQQDGTVTDDQGNVLYNKDGVVKLPVVDDETKKIINFNKVMVNAQGEIYYNKKQLGKIDLYNFADKDKLADTGDGKYISIDQENNPATLMNKIDITQGGIELSNANPISALINSLNAQRAYESMSNVMRTNSQTLQKSISSVAQAVG